MTARDDSGASIRSALTLAIAGPSRHLGRFHRGCSKSSRAGVRCLNWITLACPYERRSGQRAHEMTAAVFGCMGRSTPVDRRRAAPFRQESVVGNSATTRRMVIASGLRAALGAMSDGGGRRPQSRSRSPSKPMRGRGGRARAGPSVSSDGGSRGQPCRACRTRRCTVARLAAGPRRQPPRGRLSRRRGRSASPTSCRASPSIWAPRPRLGG